MTPATVELDSTMGVGSQIILSKEPEDESEDVYRQVKELVDEPVASGSKKENLRNLILRRYETWNEERFQISDT